MKTRWLLLALAFTCALSYDLLMPDGGRATVILAVVVGLGWLLTHLGGGTGDAELTRVARAVGPLLGKADSEPVKVQRPSGNGYGRTREVREQRPIDPASWVTLREDEQGRTCGVRLDYPPEFRSGEEAARRRVELQVEEVLGFPVSADWASYRGRAVTFMRSAELPTGKVPPPPEHMVHEHTGTPVLVVGVTDEGEEDMRRDGVPYAIWDWALAAHGLVVGKTLSGKTVALRVLIDQALRHGMQVVICDPKRKEFTYLREHPLVTLHVEQDAMVAAVADYRAEMDRRYRDDEEGPYRLLVVDEATTLIERAREAHEGRGEPQVLRDLAELARLARSAGLRLLLGLQRPDVSFLPGEAREQLDFRLVMGRTSRQAQVMAFGDDAVLPTVDAQVKGRGLLDVAGRIRRVHVCWVEAERSQDADQAKRAESPADATTDSAGVTRRGDSPAGQGTPDPGQGDPPEPRCSWCGGNGLGLPMYQATDSIDPSRTGLACAGCTALHLELDGGTPDGPPQGVPVPADDRPPAPQAPSPQAKPPTPEPASTGGRRVRPSV